MVALALLKETRGVPDDRLIWGTRVVQLLAEEDEAAAQAVADEALTRWQELRDGETYTDLTTELANQLALEAAAFFIREGYTSIK
jgi:hypothetical protein